ncbi:MAG: M50 family metallopeptidase [bacterium]|nr:M50 family metallopeptidase [bacterium]
MLTALLVIAILVLLIVAHELGHFIVAKVFRVRVEEFGVGYPPRAFTLGKWGGTEYTINWIPFGGFVRLFGDVGEGEHGYGSLVDSHRGVQAAILVAGVAANAVAAWALFAVALHLGVPQSVDVPPANQPVHLLVAYVVPSSPAWAAGIQTSDEIVGISSNKGEQLATLAPTTVMDFVRMRGGKPISVTYIHAGVTSTVSMTPANAVLPNAAGQPALGIALVLVAKVSLPWGESAERALTQTWSSFGRVGSDLWTLARGALHGAPDLAGVVGPVGIVSYVGEASQSGFGAILLLAALISVNLAIINLIPIPALDGGRLVILAVEAIMRRDAPRLALQLLNALGIGLIILLMVVVTYNDVGRLLA